jgi:hypothetical protein
LMVEASAKAGVATPTARMLSAAVFAARYDSAPMEFPRLWLFLARRASLPARFRLSEVF